MTAPVLSNPIPRQVYVRQSFVSLVNKVTQTFGPLISNLISAQIQSTQHLLVVQEFAQFDYMFVRDALLLQRDNVRLVNAPSFYGRGKTLRNLGGVRKFDLKQGLVNI